MDGTGPERKGPKSGRGMGRCKKEPGKEDSSQPVRGQGSRRKSEGGAGRGKRMGGGSARNKT